MRVGLPVSVIDIKSQIQRPRRRRGECHDITRLPGLSELAFAIYLVTAQAECDLGNTRDEFSNYFFLQRRVDGNADKHDWRLFPMVLLPMASVAVAF